MKTKDRLLSLDVLRGLDMLLLTVVGPLFWAIHKIWPQSETVQCQFKHFWGGFTLWDIIMPLFIFMCGAAIPYALSKRLDANGRPTGRFWLHVLSRVVLLWFCGLLVQGNLTSLDVLRINPYSNTLQTIAAGYLIAALVMLIPVRAIRIACPLLLAGLYGGLLHFCGDYSQAGNFASICEVKIFSAILPAGHEVMKRIAENNIPDHGYTWFLTTLMFGFMTLCGAQCAEILRGEWSCKRKAVTLFALGAGLLAAGWGLVFAGVPMIKHIFTVSFTFQAMGWCVLALALLYLLTDVLMLRRGWWLVTLFGQCALTAYMTKNFFGSALNAATERITGGVPHLIGDTYMPLVTWFTASVLLTLVCWMRRRARIAARPAPQETEDISEARPTAVPPQDNGAIAARYQLPTASAPAVPKSSETAESTGHAGPKMASKVNLKLHQD